VLFLSENTPKEHFSSVMTTETCLDIYSSFDKGKGSVWGSPEINYSQIGKSLGSYIYVFGGFVTSSSLSVERLDLHKQEWEQVSRISRHRAKFAAVCLNQNRLVIMGGKQDGNRVDSCEEFELFSGVWSPSKIRLSSSKSGFGAVVYKGTFKS
jgi:Kelch motif